MSEGSPRVSLFTSARESSSLDECLGSLQAQTWVEWEWVVVLTTDARWDGESSDSRIKVVLADDRVAGAKQRACSVAQGDVLVGLDPDDELRPDALERIVAAFAEHPEIGVVYSDYARTADDDEWTSSRWDEENGWIYSEVVFEDRKALRVHSLEAFPHNVSYVWFAPSHALAFRRSTFERAGGYDTSRDIFDDQELLCRLYELTDFHYIGECLYLQGWPHAGPPPPARLDVDGQEELTARIQKEAVALYDSYVQRAALSWSERRGFAALDLGAAHNKPDGYLGVDQYPGTAVDIVADITKGLDLPDSSVGVIRAVDFLEHVPDKVEMFNEMYRLLAHGGMVLSLTPSTDGRGAFQDPTHVAFYNENSFWYFTDATYAGYAPEIRCRFQVSRLLTFFFHPMA